MKRFYKNVEVSSTDEGFLITLDKKALLSPGKSILVVPTKALADAIADEWGNQDINIIPSTMPLMTLTATAMIFISNQHWEVLRGLAASYKALPPGGPMDVVSAVERLSEQLDTTFVLALRIVSPFVVYTVVVNLAIGLVNKLTPQIPVYFISMPFVIAGGMYFLFLVFSEAITLFLDGYFTWLKLG